MGVVALEPPEFPWLDYSRYSFSLGLDVDGRYVQLSGHSASEYDDQLGVVVKGDMEAQIETIYAKMATILETAQCSLSDVVHIVESVTLEGFRDYQTVESARTKLLGSAQPAVNTMAVDRLLRPGALIEIEATAARGETELHQTAKSTGSFMAAASVDGTVYLSTIRPENDDGSIAGVGDLAEQMRRAFSMASATLHEIGLNMEHVVKTVATIRRDVVELYDSTEEIRTAFLGPVFPASTIVVQEQVADDEDILVSYDVVASTHKPTPIDHGWDRYSDLTHQPAVLAGDSLFIAGQMSVDQMTGTPLHPGDVVAQTRQAYENITHILHSAGATTRCLIKTVERIVAEGLPDYRAAGRVRKSYLHEPWPTATGVICAALGHPESLIQVDAVALVSM